MKTLHAESVFYGFFRETYVIRPTNSVFFMKHT